MSKQNIGSDLSIQLNVGGSIVKEFGFTTDVSFKPMWSLVTTKPITNGGIPVSRSVFGGHDVEITFDRANGTADAMAQFLEDSYINGSPDVNVTLQNTIRNGDGTVDAYIYINGTVYPTNAGSFKGTDVVAMSFKFFFQQRQVISSGASPTLGGQALTAI